MPAPLNSRTILFFWVSIHKGMFSGDELTLAHIDPLGHFACQSRDMVLRPWGLITPFVSSVSFCSQCGWYCPTWSCCPPRSHAKNLGLYDKLCPHLPHQPPFFLTHQLKYHLPNGQEQKVTLIPDRRGKNGAKLWRFSPAHGRRNLGILFLSPSLSCWVMVKQTLTSTAVLLTPQQTGSYNVSPPR